ncbi:hypothetical protein [Rhodococcus sp. ARC_M6]|uniref:hypothetical protein n=1 Tax=Rhodococcus sp. ARC_M6 TaxID=2928852 RepID=UPI001FB1B676|nr:hypothetical protein [Rhodococcus sp. ARC_M6]MCJ0905662.1 hypothetical protein [Rhodococcus sp. ARC_M6]
MARESRRCDGAFSLFIPRGPVLYAHEAEHVLSCVSVIKTATAPVKSVKET